MIKDYCFRSLNRIIRYRRLSSLTPQVSFHKRQLPTSLIALSSKEGKLLFKEALELGGMEGFFNLSEQFITQSEPSFCSLSSLAMVLNALNFDPKRVWKGSWRWVSEEMLQCESRQICGHSLDKVKRDGMNFSEFEALARCHGVSLLSYRAALEQSHAISSTSTTLQGSRDHFEDIVRSTCTSDNAHSFCIVNFSRSALEQTGDGHFSPIGGYHSKKRLVLVMDVARFKYPPFWVDIDRLWKSMTLIDANTGSSRGYFLVTNREKGGLIEEKKCCDHQHHHQQHQAHHHS